MGKVCKNVENRCSNRKCFSANVEGIILEYVLIKNNFDDASDTSGIGKEKRRKVKHRMKTLCDHFGTSMFDYIKRMVIINGYFLFVILRTFQILITFVQAYLITLNE